MKTMKQEDFFRAKMIAKALLRIRPNVHTFLLSSSMLTGL